MSDEPLAHSARSPDAEPQSYRDHIAGTSVSEGVVAGARRRAEDMLRFHHDPVAARATLRSVVDAATFHDLGKLDPDAQAVLREGRGAKLVWDHIDAGVAHLMAKGAEMGGWIVRAHHAPGLPSKPAHFTSKHDRRLRGRRDDELGPDEHAAQIARTDRMLPSMIAAHEAVVGQHEPAPQKAIHGLALRLALSCLVDADHSDTAYADTQWTLAEPPAPRWEERLAALDAYVARLGTGAGQRDDLRRSFYDACRQREPDQAMVACEGPVGIGKTTAVTAYLLRRAMATRARRLFIVAPYTAILSQTADRLRAALVLQNERDRPDMVVAEHHHRADFNRLSSRDLAILWTAPVILTTAVQFFETLSANAPSALRKLNALPGSVVFLDEAHAALPAQLWPQNWRWLRGLAEDWGCSFVLASGSLARFWEIEDIVGDARMQLPQLVPSALAAPMLQAESKRVSYVTLGRLDGLQTLAERVAAAPGPRLLIMNTVQSAAVVGKYMRKKGLDVLHLSTALAPQDRDALLNLVTSRLCHSQEGDDDWTLVATSLMEAGIDLSFRTSFRERFASTSLIQIGGRANRNFEWAKGTTVYDFAIAHSDGLKAHPAAVVPADILADLFSEGMFNGAIDPAAVVTLAMRREVRRNRGSGDNELLTAEQERRYPDVAKCGRVIDADTRLVVVDPALRARIITRERLATRELLAGSVQIWARQIDALGLDVLPGRDEIYWWPHEYDPDFLGYMEGALYLQSIAEGQLTIV